MFNYRSCVGTAALFPIIFTCLSASAQTVTRSAAQQFNNANIFDNSRGQITGAVINSMFNQTFGSTGFLGDTNTWTGANTFTGPLVLPNSVTAYAANCNGAGDDSAAFTNALSVATSITMPPNRTCLVENVVINSGQTLDCNGSTLKPATSANWVVEKQGSFATIRNCVISDTSLLLMHTTTLTSDVSLGSTVLPVSSVASAQAGMVLTLQLASGAFWTTKIVSIAGLNITIADPVPATLASNPTITAGGSGYINGSECTLVGGVGAPATGHIAVTSSAVTSFTVDAPGLYQTAPSSPATITCAATFAANSEAMTFTTSGASSGAFVDFAYGALYINNANGGLSDNILIPEAAVGVQVANTGLQSYNTAEESIRTIKVNAASMVGLAKMANVNNLHVLDTSLNGFAHHSSAFGATGIYIDGRNPTIPSGGNKYDVTTLGFENGGVDQGGTLDIFTNAVFDTQRNYGFFCNGCTDSDFQDIWATFSGPNALSNAAGAGVGLIFSGSAINNSVGKLTTVGNASDLHLADNTSAVWIASEPWAWNNVMTGWGVSVQPGKPFAQIPTTGTVTGSGAVYLSPTSASTTEGAGTLNSTRGTLTNFILNAAVSPGSTTLTVNVRVNRWDTLLSPPAYDGWANTALTCIIATTSKVCAAGGPGGGVPIFQNDLIDIQVSPSGGNFPANETFTALVNGL